MMDYKDMMEQFGDAFDNQEASDFGEDVPDGLYVVLINKAEINNAKTSGRLQLSWDFTVVWDTKNCKFKNRHIYSHDGLTKVDKATGKHALADISIGYMKKRFAAIGYPNVTRRNLEQFLGDVKGKVVSLEAKTNKGYQNTYFKRLMANDMGSFQPPTRPDQLEAAKSVGAKGNASLPQRRQAAPAAPQQTAPKLKFEQE